MLKTDALCRATFHSITQRDDVTPTSRDVRWMKHIERHGPLKSSHLLDFVSDTHRCRDTGLRRLQALRAAGFLCLPKQQRATERAEFKPYVYDLAPKGDQFLKFSGESEDAFRPSGHWWHKHETAMFTAGVDLECRRRGFRYLPAHEILRRSGATLGIPMGNRTLLPDQLFAIDYGGTYRAFMLEVDRGTEPVASTGARKSWQSALRVYGDAFRKNLCNRHFGLKASIVVLWKLSTRARHGAFMDLLDAERPVALRRHFASVDGHQWASHSCVSVSALWD